MPYHDAPQPAEAENIVQGLLSDNFQFLNTYLTANHDILTNLGKHTLVTLPEIAVPVTLPTTSLLYAANSPITGQAELFRRRRDINGADETISMSESRNVTPGWTQMGNGMILKWGDSALLNGYVQVDYPLPAVDTPRFNHVFTVLASVRHNTANDVDASIRIASYDNRDYFNVYCSRRYAAGNNAVTFTWLAIGD